MEIEQSIVWVKFERLYIHITRSKPIHNQFKSSGLNRSKLN
jgi:hypothetical protein